MFASSRLEETVDVVGSTQLTAIDGQDVVARFHIYSRLGERSLQPGIPILAVVNPSHTITSILECVVGAQKSTLHLLGFWLIATSYKHMPNRDFTQGFFEQIGQFFA